MSIKVSDIEGKIRESFDDWDDGLEAFFTLHDRGSDGLSIIARDVTGTRIAEFKVTVQVLQTF